jgi:L-fuculose-phosphate aldolase
MPSNTDLIQHLIDISHRLYAKGFVAATDGNVSVRCDNGNFLTTRTSVNKGIVTAEDLVEVDSSGEPVASQQPLSPSRRPSTEIGMHLFIYSRRPDVRAIVHAHPPYATGFATAGIALDRCIAPEVIVGLGAIPLATYATPSTAEVAASLEPFVKTADAILLANHGVVTYGKDLPEAYFKMEKVEHTAHVSFVARMLGGEKTLSQTDIAKLMAVSGEAYGKPFSGPPACETGPEENTAAPHDQELRSIVRDMIRRS